MALVSQNMYNEKLDNIVNKSNYACHITIKMNPVYVKYQNIKHFLEKSVFQIGLKKFLSLKS